MQIFTHEFKTFVKGLLLCSWRGHKPSDWEAWYTTIVHFGGYRKFCKRCGSTLSTPKEEYKYLNESWVETKPKSE